MHIHILGICGTFMGGLAALAREAGHVVTGCDTAVYPPMSDQLRALGIELIEGYGVEQMALKPDVYVIGNVVSRVRLSDGTPKFPLMEAILNAGAPYTSGPQWLSEHILQGRHVLAVAGTHGKTTTSAMLAWILEEAGFAPGFLIGGIPQNFGISARLGRVKSPNCQSPFVIEADEYDSAFFDKRSKFVHYRPRTAVLNNLEFDHADIFDDLNAIERQFHHFIRTVPSSGNVICNVEFESLKRVLAKGCWSPITSFGEHGDVFFKGDASRFEVLHQGHSKGVITWGLTGRHSQMNAVAAIAAAMNLGIEIPRAAEALCCFESVKRRMEVRGTVGGVTVYDDFAHHPSAIQTTLQGLRKKSLQGRVFAIFEPRSNTMKIGSMKSMLADSFENADLVYCYTQGLDWDAAEALKKIRPPLTCSSDLSELIQSIIDHATQGDHLVCMSNGAFGGIHEKLLDALSSNVKRSSNK